MSYVTGISGNVISAASAGWAPTNSAEVSAIASAYATGAAQVVTAVGTETAITPDGVGDVVTSINGNYITALSADSAFIAEYDDRGRLLTSLPSESDISSIASAYATGKQDTLTFGYDDDKISAINGSALAGQGGGIDSATCSAIASAYAESAVSSVSGNYYTTANESGFLTAVSSDGGVQVYATGTETSTNQFSAANASAGASLIAGTKARVRLWDSDYTGNIYASSIQTWNNKIDSSAIQYVAGSADATANGVLYILTGNA